MGSPFLMDLRATYHLIKRLRFVYLPKYAGMATQEPSRLTWLSIIGGGFLLCFWAFYNQYPLLNPDTGSYLFTGYRFEVPQQRSIFYGLFLRYTSVATTAWFTVFAQGIILSGGIYLFLKNFTSFRQLPLVQLLVLTVLTFTTSLSFHVSQLMPDIFTGFSLLCLVLLLLGRRFSRFHIGLLIVGFLLGLTTHSSHLLINLVLVVGMGIYYFWQRKTLVDRSFYVRRWLLTTSLVAFGWLLVPSVHASMANGSFSINQGSTIFTVNRLIEIGVMERFLYRHCKDNTEYILCPYKDDLPKEFMWDEARSPLYKTGGWMANHPAYQQLIRAVLSEPDLLKTYLLSCFSSTLSQLATFDIPYPTPLNKFTHEQLQQRLSEWRAFNYSKQHEDLLDFKPLSSRQLTVVFVCLILLWIAFFHTRLSHRLSSEQRRLTALLLMGMVINDAVCSSISMVDLRFGSRVIWLLPLLILVLYAKDLQRLGRKIEAFILPENPQEPMV